MVSMATDSSRLLLVLFLCLMPSSMGYPRYQDMIPNGGIVPHPCKANYLWRGVGHLNVLGGGPRNSFGLHFEQYRQWLPDLCRLDSDGDGLTNGQELGDPGCVWTIGSLPSRTTDLTHPGVCDPWGSEQCNVANMNVSCASGEFECEHIKSPDVMNITIRFPVTSVPPTLTSYFCKTFDLADYLDPNKDYHLVGTKPHLDNQNVIHHIALLSCVPQAPVNEPSSCYMADPLCPNSLSIWTVGLAGECGYHEAGFKIGRHGAMKIAMQFHWTNPELRSDYTDSSGLTLFYTEKLRKYNAGYFTTGPSYLNIPPGLQRHPQTSTCSSRCTSKIMTGNIYLTSGWNHMHYLGYQGNVEMFSGGEKVHDLTKDEIYSYDNPVIHEYATPIQMSPGDQLETTCVYRSTSRANTTYFGDGTFDEMCLGIFTYYPLENLTTNICTTWKNVEMCDLLEWTQERGCDLYTFFDLTHNDTKDMYNQVMDHCDRHVSPRDYCLYDMAKIRSHPCFAEELHEFIMFGFKESPIPALQHYGRLLESCDCSLNPFTSSANSLPAAAVSAIVLASLLVTIL